MAEMKLVAAKVMTMTTEDEKRIKISTAKRKITQARNPIQVAHAHTLNAAMGSPVPVFGQDEEGSLCRAWADGDELVIVTEKVEPSFVLEFQNDNGEIEQHEVDSNVFHSALSGGGDMHDAVGHKFQVTKKGSKLAAAKRLKTRNA